MLEAGRDVRSRHIRPGRRSRHCGQGAGSKEAERDEKNDGPANDPTSLPSGALSLTDHVQSAHGISRADALQ